MQIRNKVCWYLLTAIIHAETDVIQKLVSQKITVTTTEAYTTKEKKWPVSHLI